MCRTILTVSTYALGVVILSVSSILIYQWVVVVPVVAPSAPAGPPAVVQTLPPGLTEPMDLDTAPPAGRLLRLPSTGRD